MTTVREMQNNIAAQLRGMARVDIGRVEMIAAGTDLKYLAHEEIARRRVMSRAQFIQSLTDAALAAVEAGRVDLAEIACQVCSEY